MAEKVEVIAELKDLVTGKMNEINQAVNRLEGSLQRAGNAGASQGGGIMGQVLGANLLTNGIQRVAGAIYDFGKESFEAYGKNEMYEARLTTLLHSREDALLSLKQITKDAALTPFDKSSLVQANSMLIGAGESAGGARKSVMDLGNAIAATGGGSDELSRMSVNLAQIKSIGKASALDVKQFMYANIPIYEMLSKSMGVNVTKIKEMDISYKDLTKALSDARQEGGLFYQGLENANHTLIGQESNLGDQWERLKTSIGESQSGILMNTIKWAGDMVDALNQSFDRTKTIKLAIGKYGGSERSYLGGSEKNNERVNALADMTTRSSERAFDSKESAVKEQKFLMSMLNFKVDEYKTALSSMKTSTEMKYEGDIYTNEISVIRGALSDVNHLLKNFNKKAIKTDVDADADADAVKKASELEKVAKQNRPTQININIENLVKGLTNIVNNSTGQAMEFTSEMVAKALLSSVNDISVLGQQ